MTEPTTARQRGGETKRARTRAALIASAADVFAAKGWANARLEDIARQAGVSVATAYNHFRSKHALIGHVCLPLVEPLRLAAAADVETQRDPVQSIRRHVRDLAVVISENRRLTHALVAAVQEETIRTGGPPRDPDDVRLIVPLPQPLAELISDGQRRDLLRLEPSAREVAAYHTNGLVVRLISRPAESPDQLAGLVLSQLIPALDARTESPGRER